MNPAEPDMVDDLLSRQAAWLEDYEFRLRLTEQGNVVSVGETAAAPWFST